MAGHSREGRQTRSHDDSRGGDSPGRPPEGPGEVLLRLQREHGNAAVQRLLARQKVVVPHEDPKRLAPEVERVLSAIRSASARLLSMRPSPNAAYASLGHALDALEQLTSSAERSRNQRLVRAVAKLQVYLVKVRRALRRYFKLKPEEIAAQLDPRGWLLDELIGKAGVESVRKPLASARTAVRGEPPFASHPDRRTPDFESANERLRRALRDVAAAEKTADAGRRPALAELREHLEKLAMRVRAHLPEQWVGSSSRDLYSQPTLEESAPSEIAASYLTPDLPPLREMLLAIGATKTALSRPGGDPGVDF